MEEDEVTVEGQDFHYFSSLGPLAWLASLLSCLVLEDDCVSADEGVKLLGADEEPLFHLGELLGMSLPPEVCFHYPRLVLVNLSWEEALELSAKDDHG